MKKILVISWFYPPINSSEGLVTYKLLRNSKLQYDVCMQESNASWSYGNKEYLPECENVRKIPIQADTLEIWKNKTIEYFNAHKKEYDIIMTRSMPPESHEIGLKIKEIKPEIKWIASFGDPIANNPFVLKTIKKISPYSLQNRYIRPMGIREIISPKRMIKNEIWKKRMKKECHRYISNMEEALSYLRVNGIISVESNIADEMMNEADSHFEGVFDTCNEAMNFVDRHAKKEGTDPYGRIWYILKKWIKNDDGEYYDACSYVVADDEIYYAELDNTPNGEKREDSIDYCDGMNLNLPVPFQAGDLIYVNGFPYAIAFPMLILTVGDNRSCCSVRALSKTADDTWYIGSVKHGRVGYFSFPTVSPLYTATIWRGNMGIGDEILKEMQEYIGSDPKRGQQFCEDFLGYELSEKELENIVKE